jgi:hypothetical protein
MEVLRQPVPRDLVQEVFPEPTHASFAEVQELSESSLVGGLQLIPRESACVYELELTRRGLRWVSLLETQSLSRILYFSSSAPWEKVLRAVVLEARDGGLEEPALSILEHVELAGYYGVSDELREQFVSRIVREMVERGMIPPVLEEREGFYQSRFSSRDAAESFSQLIADFVLQSSVEPDGSNYRVAYQLETPELAKRAEELAQECGGEVLEERLFQHQVVKAWRLKQVPGKEGVYTDGKVEQSLEKWIEEYERVQQLSKEGPTLQSLAKRYIKPEEPVSEDEEISFTFDQSDKQQARVQEKEKAFARLRELLPKVQAYRKRGIPLPDELDQEWMDLKTRFGLPNDVAMKVAYEEAVEGEITETLTAVQLKRRLTEAFGGDIACPTVEGSDAEGVKPTRVQYVKDGNVFSPVGEVTLVPALQSFGYRVYNSIRGPVFEKVKARTDELYTFKNSAMDKIVAEVNKFWGLKGDFTHLGFRHNRGILVFGPPGTGKSCLMQQVAESMINRGDVIFFSKHLDSLIEGLRAFREVEPERKLVVVLEDLDEYVTYSERDLLQLLDGDTSIDNVLYLGSTNYIERFPPRLLRPGRFDKKVYLGPPTLEARRVYLSHKLEGVETPEKVLELAKKTEGLSFGHLRELVIGVYALKEPLEEVLERLHDRDLAEVEKNCVSRAEEPERRIYGLRESEI